MLSDEQITAQNAAFFEKYPDIRKSEPVRCLNLIMKKEFALDILRGVKTVEFRSYSQHYWDRLFDKDLMDKAQTVADEDMDDFSDFARPLRTVEKIHFHNYNNSWYLDVEVTDNWTVIADDEGVRMLHEEYGCDELDELVEDLNRSKQRDRPIFFYFALGRVLGTDLKL